MTWQVGQKATINRHRIVTVERVTPSGRVVADRRTFDANGRERGECKGWKRGQLEPLTDEIQAEMDLLERGKDVNGEAICAVDDADRWLREVFGTWGGKVPDAADVDKAEALTAAIRQIIGSAGGE